MIFEDMYWDEFQWITLKDIIQAIKNIPAKYTFNGHTAYELAQIELTQTDLNRYDYQIGGRKLLYLKWYLRYRIHI